MDEMLNSILDLTSSFQGNTQIKEQRSNPLNQQSPTFLAPRTGFLEDNFPENQGVGDGFRMIQGYCIYCGFYVYYFCIVIYNEITIQVTGNAKRVGALSLFSWNVTVPSLGDGKRWGTAVNTDEASLTGLLLTSCCAGWFLTDQGLVLVLVRVVEPCFKPNTWDIL